MKKFLVGRKTGRFFKKFVMIAVLSLAIEGCQKKEEIEAVNPIDTKNKSV